MLIIAAVVVQWRIFQNGNLRRDQKYHGKKCHQFLLINVKIIFMRLNWAMMSEQREGKQAVALNVDAMNDIIANLRKEASSHGIEFDGTSS